MRFENTAVYNIYNAILGARNPMNSWDKSDSVFKGYNGKIENTSIGKNDLELMQKLIKAGSEHRKFLRQIFVAVDITAPLYFFKELDTYKVGTVANSTSTMHKLASTPITIDCFEMDDFEDCKDDSNVYVSAIWVESITRLEKLRQTYNETKDKRYWKELIRLLPESWLQTRMFDCDYATLRNIYCWRVKIPHKLTEWKQFGNWVESLPYAKELICS